MRLSRFLLFKVKQKENRQIALVAEVLRGLQPTVRSFCNRLTLILDILPLLVLIIVPNFRPVNLHLYTKEEKENMLAVVNVMVDYNLNYVQERQNDGTFVFNLGKSWEFCDEEWIFMYHMLQYIIISLATPHCGQGQYEVRYVFVQAPS